MMPTNDAPAADRLAALLDEARRASTAIYVATDKDTAAAISLLLTRLADALTSRLAVSGEPPREPSDDAIQAAIEAPPCAEAPDCGVTACPRCQRLALTAAYAAEGAAPRAPRAPDGPWQVNRQNERPIARQSSWPATGPYFVVCKDDGSWCAASLVEERAIAIRDALNRVAGAVPPEEPHE